MPKIYLVDAFSHGPFTGNPAGVCPLEGAAPEAWMQNVAMEMNQAETAFCWPEGEGYRLRWFTPTAEVELCGHATLATAHVLGNPGQTTFYTKSGFLFARSEGGKITLDFPSEVAQSATIEMPLDGAVWTGKNRMDWVAVLKSEKAVRDFQPDFEAIKSLGQRGLIVTAPGEEDSVDFVSRFFAPAVGVYEDPVTGSAHCCLCPLWAERLGKKEMRGYQASLRGGSVDVVLKGDRVELIGFAVTTLEGNLSQVASPPHS